MKHKEKDIQNTGRQRITFSEEDKDALASGYAELSRKLSAVERLSVWLERSRLYDYVLVVGDKKRVFWINVLAGIGRGIGFTIGFLLLGALFLYILDQFINLPLIGDFIAELLKYIEEVKGLRI